MPAARIEVDGIKELRGQFKQAGIDLKELKGAGLEAAEVVAVEGRRTAPRRSGALAETIRAAGQVGGGVVRAGFARIPYAGVIHFGWPGHNIEPQPWLFEATDAKYDAVIETYWKHVDKITKEAGSQ